jgi:CubicO group peptidase (beta-lactamase class C family)
VSGPLEAIAGWPVPTAAAAVVGPSGVLATYGPVEEPFYLASVTKLLAALAVLVAVEEDAVGLDDPAGDPVPDATLRHLLAHASGLAFDRPVRAGVTGTRRIYSNCGIERAAAMVEAATDIAFGRYLDEAVVRPLRLAATTLPGSPAAAGRASVSDLARVALELLSPSGLLAQATLTDALTVQWPGLRGVLPGFGMQDPNDWGLGFEIRGAKAPHWTGTRNSARTVGHFGQSGTFLWVDPEARLGLVALTDRDFDDWARTAWPELSDAVLDAYA